MASKIDPEIRGNFLMHPFGEVLAEITQARLSGSLRVAAKDKKRVFYFRDGRLVFAVSNARESRLYHLLLSKGTITQDDLRKVPNLTNDLELAAYLLDTGSLNSSEKESVFTDQIKQIVVDVLGWAEGDWSFSHLARARDSLDFDLSVTDLLVEYARALPQDQVFKRFRSLSEKFGRSDLLMNGLVLRPDESFVLSRADQGLLSAADLANISAMPEKAALQVLYTLWLAGYLERADWQRAFSEATIEIMRYSKLELKKEARVFDLAALPSSPSPEDPSKQGDIPPVETPKALDLTLDVEEFLTRVEGATTYYDMLGVGVLDDAAEIRKMYFGLAKKFHPDKYHSEGAAIRKRVQNAFTEISQAHETLKDTRSREVYDYRMRNEITARKNAESSGESLSTSVQLLQASEAFDRGFNLLMNREVEEALPLLARAVHYAPKNARYHAYYGKALSLSDETKRHKAEAEMQAALKLDPQNATFRLILIEFFIDIGLKKRAEGELTRLLAIFPDNKDAKGLLASLKKT